MREPVQILSIEPHTVGFQLMTKRTILSGFKHLKNMFEEFGWTVQFDKTWTRHPEKCAHSRGVVCGVCF